MAALRDIVVVLDNSAPSEERLAVAVALAKRHGSHLTGLSTLDALTSTRSSVRRRSESEAAIQRNPQLVDWGGISSRDYPEEEARAAEVAERIEAAFRERLWIDHLEGDWRITNGNISDAAVYEARNADLVIVGQADPEHPSTYRNLVEELLVTAGRPILVIPYIGHFTTLGTKVLVVGIIAVRRPEP